MDVQGAATASVEGFGGTNTNSKLTKIGTGTLTINGASSYGGKATVSDGTLLATSASALAGYTAANRVSVANGATLAVRASDTAGVWTSTEIDSLLGATTNAFASGSKLGIDVATGNTFSYATNIGTTQAAKGLVKSGAGTLTLSTSNTYTGATTVNGGTLNVTGSTNASSAVSVGGASATGTPKLSGSGTINGTVTVKSAGLGVVGILDAGDAASANPAGKLTVNNNLTFETGSIFEWDIKDGSTMTESADDRGVQYDAVDITGGGALSVTDSVFRVVMNVGEFNTGNFWDTDRSWASSSIFNVGGSLDGFTTLEWYEGATLKGQSSNLAGRSTDGYFSISGTSLTWTAVPEPTSALAGLLITAGLLRRRRAVG